MSSSNSLSGSAPAARPRRRWLQYSLRSLFVLTAICAVPAWRAATWLSAMDEENRAYEFLKSQGYVIDESESPSLIERCFPFMPNTGLDAEPPLWFRRISGRANHRQVTAVSPKMPITKANMLLLQKFPGLRALFAQNHVIEDGSLKLLETSPHIYGIHIHHCTFENEKELRNLSNLPELRAIDLSDSNISREMFLSICELPQLERLTIQNSAVPDAWLTNLSRLPNLRYLELYQTKSSANCFGNLKNIPSLRELVIDSSFPQSAEGISALAGTQITGVSLAGFKITDSQLVYFTEMPELARLSLSDTDITRDGLQTFKKIPKLSTLLLVGFGKYLNDEDMKLFTAECPGIEFPNFPRASSRSINPSASPLQ